MIHHIQINFMFITIIFFPIFILISGENLLESGRSSVIDNKRSIFLIVLKLIECEITDFDGKL